MDRWKWDKRVFVLLDILYFVFFFMFSYFCTSFLIEGTHYLLDEYLVLKNWVSVVISLFNTSILNFHLITKFFNNIDIKKIQWNKIVFIIIDILSFLFYWMLCYFFFSTLFVSSQGLRIKGFFLDSLRRRLLHARYILAIPFSFIFTCIIDYRVFEKCFQKLKIGEWSKYIFVFLIVLEIIFSVCLKIFFIIYRLY